ncbi:hypothetical protein WHR41_04265 [Cladosporium halotolerans]|uniref:1,3-beta-glucanosyltransferase n=1 Tax=Cladosporium halotolerans TaxID=1052096 RepID=A0AB34KQQ9_9PEZI
MKGFSFGAVAAAAIAGTSMLIGRAAAADVDPIVIKGSKFFYKTNGTQFYMRGVAYQQEYSGSTSGSDSNDNYKDPLADVDGCKRDIPVLQELRTNTIRVYAINPEADHQECMTMLSDAGIYVVADLSQPATSIIRNDPAWDDELYARYAEVIDEMSQFSNTLGFFAGNEVSNQPNNTDASAFVKAAVRDMKAYIKQKEYRPMGVGYATNDDAAIRNDMAAYFDCGDEESSIDFWGYNIYSWCGDSSFEESGYDVQTKNFEKYNVPVFFAEYGCNEVKPRKFTDVPVLYGPKMNDVWSGGIVYMYFQEANDYGLVKVQGDSVSKREDFSAYSSQIATISPTGVKMADYSPTNSAAACPTEGKNWNAKSSPLPPTPNKQLCACMYNSLTCTPNADISAESVGELFGTVCGLGDGSQCDGIAANASTGDFGAYSMCNSTEKLGWVMDAYYQAQSGSNQASACDFDGNAATKSAVSPSGVCGDLMQEAGSAGTGVVSTKPTATGAGAAANNGAGESGSASGSGSQGAGAMFGTPSYTSGSWQAVSLLAVGLFSGFGMILL